MTQSVLKPAAEDGNCKLTVAIGGHADGTRVVAGPSSGTFSSSPETYILSKATNPGTKQARYFYVAESLGDSWAPVAKERWSLGVRENCLRYTPTPEENRDLIRFAARDLYAAHYLMNQYAMSRQSYGGSFVDSASQYLAQMADTARTKILSAGGLFNMSKDALGGTDPQVAFVSASCDPELINYNLGRFYADQFHESLRLKFGAS